VDRTQEQKQKEANEVKKEEESKKVDDASTKLKLLFANEQQGYNDRLRVIQTDETRGRHLASARTFAEMNLPNYLLQGIYAMNFVRPSSIQEVALPYLLRNPPQDMIGQAQSGSGKTATFVVGMLARIDTSRPVTQALCVAPTRELAIQIMDECVIPMSSYMPGFTKILAISGVNLQRNQKITEHLVVGTPGKVLDWIEHRNLNVENITVFVLDEADHMIADSGLQSKTKKIKNFLSKKVQSLFFSATFSTKLFEFAKTLVHTPVTIKLRSDEELVLDVIQQFWMDLQNIPGGKLQLLSDIYDVLVISQSIIFVERRTTADEVMKCLNEKGFSVSKLHADMSGEERDACMSQFRSKQTSVLITTNVLARGVDVPGVTVVVNYDLPRMYDDPASPDFETYLHRIGRTGRFGRRGIAINFVENEHDKDILRKIEGHFSPGREMIFQAPADDILKFEEMIIQKTQNGP